MPNAIRTLYPIAAALALAAGSASATPTIWIGHSGNYGSGGGPAGQVGIYTAPTNFTPVQTYTRISGLASGAGKVYAYAAGGNQAQGALKTIDAKTGAEIASVLEPLNSDGENGNHMPLGDLAIDPTTGLLYGAAAQGSAGAGNPPNEYYLYTVNPADGSRTLLGSAGATFTPKNGSGMAIAFNAEGTLFALDQASNYLAILNKNDASFISGVTLTMPAGALWTAMGLGFDFGTGNLIASYWSLIGDEEASGLMTIHPTTYATAVLGDFADTRHIGDITVTSVPAPATLPLLAIGALGAGIARRRQN
jgi:hypothetical protein